MGATLDLVTDLIRSDTNGSGPPLEPTFTTGPSDPLGDRIICFTAHGATAFELLRFKPEWGDAPGFEKAIRSSVEAIGRLNPALAPVRAVERIDELNGLTLVSMRQSGKRLSEVMPRTSSTAYAIELVKEIGPALALLHAAGHAHGALTPDRIVVSREGRLIVLEHVLGEALATLALPAGSLRALTGIAVGDGDGATRIVPRLDVVQLGFIALSVIAGERLAPSDYPRRVPLLLDQFSRSDPPAARVFRPWLESALQLGDRRFADAADALAAFRKLPDVASTPATAQPGWPARPSRPRVAEPSAVSVAPPPKVPPAAPVSGRVERPRPATLLPSPAALLPRQDVEDATTVVSAALDPNIWSNSVPHLRRVVGLLAALVIVQSALLAYVFLSGHSPAFTPVVNAAPAPVPTQPRRATRPPPDTSTSDAAVPELFSIADGGPGVPVPPPDGTMVLTAAEAGSVTMVSPIELQVFEGDVRIGASAEPITLAAGVHMLEVVNDDFGFRARQEVTIFGGGATSVTVAVPDGQVDIDASPAAEVWINGVMVGRTPIASLALPIGRHEILFRHPELGERREAVVVRADGVASLRVVLR